MDFLEGVSLAELLHNEGPLSPERALPILEQVADAVDYAHRQGVLHRDIKPGNIFLTTDTTGASVAKVLDFGLAHLMETTESEWNIKVTFLEQPLLESDSQDFIETVAIDPGRRDAPPFDSNRSWTQPIEKNQYSGWSAPASPDPHDVVGTAAYMAPEIVTLMGISPSVDVYAFGVTAYVSLVGRLPFVGSTSEVLLHQARTEPPRPTEFNSSIPVELEPALLSPLSKDPAKRPKSLLAATLELRSAIELNAFHKWEQIEIPRRKKLTVGFGVAGLLLALLLPFLGPLRNLEHRFQDVRMSLASPRSADSRILLVGLDEATLDDGSTNFFDHADRLVEGIDELFKAGAQSVGIDLVLPRRYSESETLSKLVMNHRDQLVLALYSSPSGQLKGWECLSELTRAQFKSTSDLASQFGIINLESDSDGRVRHFRSKVLAKEGLYIESMALRMLRGNPERGPRMGEIPIDYSLDPGTYMRLTWKDLHARLRQNPQMIRGRYVLIGAGFTNDEDVHLVPSIRNRPKELSGLAIHALMLQTLLDGERVRQAPNWTWCLGFLLVAGASAWILLRASRLVFAWVVVITILFASAFLALILGSKGIMLPMASTLVAGLCVILCAALARRRLPAIPKLPSSS
jgi:serine/threonine protein kinase